MKLSVTETNKSTHLTINHLRRSGELTTIHEHVEPVAELRPAFPDAPRKRALAYFRNGLRIRVKKAVDEVIEAGRRRRY